jgi:predicted secreted protein
MRTTMTMTIATAAISALAVAAPTAALANDSGKNVTQLPSTVSIKTGQSVTLTLTTNTTTGYTWKASIPKQSTVSVSKGVYKAPASDAMGAAGTTTWTIKGTKSGKTVVTIVATAPDGTQSTTDANGQTQALTVKVAKK